MTLQADCRVAAGRFDVAVALTAPPGVTVLTGASGAGKTTALLCVAGLRRPHAGRIALDGAIWADAAAGTHLPTQDRRVGVVFQDGGLLPHRRALDDVALAVRGGSRAHRRQVARSWLERVGAADLAAASPAALSGGQAQRVALARALAGAPRVLLLDEPFGALDRGARRELGTLVRAEAEARAIPVLLVTHDADEARTLADAVVPCSPGRVGTP